MTVCVAALCDNKMTLILAADKMIGTASIEAELEVEKTKFIHKDWRVMFAGNDISPIPDIIEGIRNRLPRTSVSLAIIRKAVMESYQETRLKDAEAAFLSPLKLTIGRFFKDGKRLLGQEHYLRVLQRIYEHEFEISLIVAGFDKQGKGHILGLDSETRGRPFRSFAGFHAIGSGSPAARHIMFYRSLSPKMPARLALYLAFEAKYWGEAASGVGPRTDLYVFRRGKPPVKIDENIIEGVLVEKLCRKLEPREINGNHLTRMNEIDIPLKRLKWLSAEQMKKEKYKSFLSLVRT